MTTVTFTQATEDGKFTVNLFSPYLPSTRQSIEIKFNYSSTSLSYEKSTFQGSSSISNSTQISNGNGTVSILGSFTPSTTSSQPFLKIYFSGNGVGDIDVDFNKISINESQATYTDPSKFHYNIPKTSAIAKISLNEDSSYSGKYDPFSSFFGPDLTITKSPSHGTLKIISSLIHGDSWTYKPSPNYNGSDSFSITASDMFDEKTITVNADIKPIRDDLNLHGTAGDDNINGDLIDVGSFDIIYGLTGNDKLSGLSGNDTLDGGLGDDTLDGGLGIDNMAGGDGSDLYYLRDTGDLVSETNAASGGGSDTVYSYLSSYTLGANVEDGRIMTTGEANLTGNTLNNIIYASAGNNKLGGGTGTDTLSYAYGTTGTKGVTASLASTLVQATGGSGFDTLSGFENLTGSSNNDRLTGSSGNNVLNGGTGTDALIGGAGDDTYYVDMAGDAITETSTGGKDLVLSSFLGIYVMGAYVEEGRISTTAAASLTGNGLANTLYAGAGNNTLDGGTGTDTASYQYGLISGATAGVNVSLAITTAQATGRSGTDTLANIENLTGSNLNDILTGSVGSNILEGSLGADKLDGGAGNDTLIGGAGKDTLVGGNGNDSFDFNALSEMGTTSASWDVISGFVRGQDKIDLSTLDANTATTVDNAFNGTLIASTAKFSAAGQLKLASGVLYGNTDADADAEFAIQLTGITTLSAADFVL